MTAANIILGGSGTDGKFVKVYAELIDNNNNVNSPLNAQYVTQFQEDGTEGTEISSVQWVSGKSGIDQITNVLEIIDYAHHEIHSGSTYRAQAFNNSIEEGATVCIGFYVPAGIKLPHMTWDYNHEGNMTMTVLEGPTITVGTGTDRLCRNSRRDAGDVSFLQGTGTGSLVSNYVTVQPTYTGGTAVSLKRSFAAKGVGASGGKREEVILAADTYYVFCLTNNETRSQGGQVRLEWYEHIDKNV